MSRAQFRTARYVAFLIGLAVCALTGPGVVGAVAWLAWCVVAWSLPSPIDRADR